MRRLAFDPELAASYSSPTQRARVLSEHWTNKHVYCPNCGRKALTKAVNNKPASDFFCPDCQEVYELKSRKGSFGRKLTDGAYATMIKRLKDDDNPNLFLLNYNLQLAQVTKLLVVPRHFLVPEIIERRKPLAATARRAGWVGCNINLQGIPQTGRISLVEAGRFRPKAEVLADWRKTLFVRQQKRPDARGWLIHVMRRIEDLKRDMFSIADVYQFEDMLRLAYPENKHIRPKLRQQLQRLRDVGYLDFLGDGIYKLRRDAKATISPS